MWFLLMKLSHATFMKLHHKDKNAQIVHVYVSRDFVNHIQGVLEAGVLM